MVGQSALPTRQRLLIAGHEEVYLHGFHGASLGAILQRAGVTKGAFFHYFASKNAFGYSIVEEILAQMIAAQWVTPLEASSDPLTTIGTEFERGIEVLAAQQPILGCPLNNLAQEMNPLDAGFRARTTQVFQTWREAYRSALTRAQQRQIVLATVDPSDVAHLLVAQIEGTLSLARNTQDPQTLTTGARALRSYLASLRAPGQRAAQKRALCAARTSHSFVTPRDGRADWRQQICQITPRRSPLR